MFTNRNIILALIVVMGATTALYAERGNRRDNRAAPRGKDKPVLQDKRAPQPQGRMDKSRTVAVNPKAQPARTNDRSFDRHTAAPAKPVGRTQPTRTKDRTYDRRPDNHNQPVRKDVKVVRHVDRHPQPVRKEVKIIKVVNPKPRPIVNVVRVYNPSYDVMPCYQYSDKEVFYVTIVNETGRAMDLELEGSHEGDDDIGKLYPGEAMRYPLVVKSKKLPETFELEAGPFEAEFTLTRCSPRDMVLVITPDGIYEE